MFKKVLVANRGEIAVHIVRTLKEMNIKSVAIYTDADKESLHVQLADEAVKVGGNKAQDSYLNIKSIISAAIGTNCDAIHPGYGFLSENEYFAEMCSEVGIKFIGPESKVIELMGNKSRAKETMKQANVPLIPGSDGPLKYIEEALKIANEVQYPVLLKAASGGGGKGIRIVNSDEELVEQYSQVKTEAMASFGNDELYLEKVMQNVKHIEVQIFRDSFGNAVYFPERDCSMQRFKQKVIEETPCILLNDSERKELGEIAIRAANEINYINTGTVEFLMDDSHKFYFLEMNTRIQVEHSVTEMVTNTDLVREQIRVADGQKLKFKQEDLKPKGYSIECRINSEDPDNNFAPSIGEISYLYLPVGNIGVRFDTHIYSTYKISPFYDAMICKTIVWDTDRRKAISKMRRVLGETLIKGVKTNLDFQIELMNDEIFLSGLTTTSYLSERK